MTNTSLDIVKIIEDNPMSILDEDLQCKLTSKIISQFDKEEKKLFIASFYCYLKYDKNKEFIINLEDIWKWLGFSRKSDSKKILVKYFKKDIDYCVEESCCDRSIGSDPVSKSEKTFCGDRRKMDKENSKLGRKTEKILMTVNCFKKLCMKARTAKADKIHDYYLKMEEILHETLEESSEILKNKLLLKDNLLKSKEELIKQQEIEINNLRKKKEYIYIGHTTVYQTLIKIGITEDLTLRLEQHRSSNPKFEYLFTYKSENVEYIENIVKLILKNWRCKKPEWFEINYQQAKDVLDFGVMMYDSYKVHEDVKNLTNFISRYRKNRLVNHCHSRQYFLHKDYERYFNENIIINNDQKIKTPLSIILNDFEDWVYYNNIKCDKKYKSDLNNFSREFIKEFKEKIEVLSGIDFITKMSISDEKRNLYFSGAGGWKGLDLKTIINKSKFYEEDIYKKYIDERVIITNYSRNKLILRYVIQDFVNWCDKNSIESPRRHQMQARGKYSNVFQNEVKLMFKKITKKEYNPTSSYHGVAGVFVSLTSNGWDCKPVVKANEK